MFPISVQLETDLTLSLASGFTAPATLIATRYSANNAIALLLVSNDGIGEPLTTITTNSPGFSEKLPAGQFLCKSYSENDGMDKWLEDNNIAKATGDYVQLGFVCLPIMELNPKYLPLIAQSLN